MHPIKRLAHSAYYLGTCPLRQARLRQLAAGGRVPMRALFYHRVADTHPNSWSISRQDFARQMQWLQDHVELISLGQMQRRMRDQTSWNCAASVTFDDGYAENCDFALPLLVRSGIPVTYFVSLEYIKTGRSFPHDAQRGQHLPPNTLTQLRAMVDAGIEIGAHTATHPDMGSLHDPDAICKEMVDATEELADCIGQPIRYFAFPFGMPSNLNAVGAQMAAEQAGIQGVCSAFGGYNHPGTDPFHIRRLHGDPEFTRWRNWVAYDVRIDRQASRLGHDLEISHQIQWPTSPIVTCPSPETSSRAPV